MLVSHKYAPLCPTYMYLLISLARTCCKGYRGTKNVREREGLTLKHMGIEKAVLKKHFNPNNPKSKKKVK